jgi:hypothetical protein
VVGYYDDGDEWMLVDAIVDRFKSARSLGPLVTFEDIEAGLRPRLEALPPAARAELLHVRRLPDFDRAYRIGEFWEHRRRAFAEFPDRLRGGRDTPDGARWDAAGARLRSRTSSTPELPPITPAAQLHLLVREGRSGRRGSSRLPTTDPAMTETKHSQGAQGGHRECRTRVRHT